MKTADWRRDDRSTETDWNLDSRQAHSRNDICNSGARNSKKTINDTLDQPERRQEVDGKKPCLFTLSKTSVSFSDGKDYTEAKKTLFKE